MHPAEVLILVLSVITCIQVCREAVFYIQWTISALKVVWEAIEFFYTFILNSFEYASAIICVLGKLIGAMLHCISVLLDFFVWIWLSPISARTSPREDFANIIQAESGEAVKVPIQNSFLAVRAIMLSAALVVLVTYRRELRWWFTRIHTEVDLSDRLTCAKNKVLLCYDWVNVWIPDPVRLAITRVPVTVMTAMRTTGAVVRSKVADLVATIQVPSLSFLWVNSDKDKEVLVKTLQNDVRQLQMTLEEERESKLCIICQSNQREVVCMPCKHFATCEECTSLLSANVISRKICPICRTQINFTVKVFL